MQHRQSEGDDQGFKLRNSGQLKGTKIGVFVASWAQWCYNSGVIGTLNAYVRTS